MPTSEASMRTAIVWFRRDLRLADNPALNAALASFDRVVPLYVHAPREEAPWQAGAASRWWLHHSLGSLDAALRKRGSALHVAKGSSLAALRRVIETTGAGAVFWNRLYEPAVIARDTRVKEALLEDGLDARSFNGALLFEPWEIETGQGGPYRVFTPFWRNERAKLEIRPPLPAPRALVSVESSAGLSVDALGLLPKIGWAAGFADAWQPGEVGAANLLRRFIADAIGDYPAARDLPATDGTSRLSPHLHFGEISPMQVAWALKALEHGATSASRSAGAEAYLREIGWREFSHHLLYHFPQTPDTNLNDNFDRFGWAVEDSAILARWQRGRTGIPIVDAGMRQLWATGWMHNRVRMLVASFLTKNLRQHWHLGARWFWDTLVDADLANNTQGWQWTAGTGADAAPYFRVFNAVTQASRFDAGGDYVRRWVPELAGFSGKGILQPWLDADRLRRSGYPPPMVDLGRSRDDALAAYKALRQDRAP